MQSYQSTSFTASADCSQQELKDVLAAGMSCRLELEDKQCEEVLILKVFADLLQLSPFVLWCLSYSSCSVLVEVMDTGVEGGSCLLLLNDPEN